MQDRARIETAGEAGVILLPVAIGLEFPFKRLLESWREVRIGGLIQVCTTILAASGMMYLARVSASRKRYFSVSSS